MPYIAAATVATQASAVGSTVLAPEAAGGGVAPGAGGEGGEATTADPAVSAAATGHHVLKNKSAWAKPNADKQPGRAQKTHRAGATTHT
jgi:hypothetical protein